MPKGMSEDVSKVVVDALNRGKSRGEISSVVGISKRAITRINSNLKKHGTAKPPPTGAKLGRPVKLTKSQAEAMIVWMAQRDHTFYVKDLVAFLRDQYRYKGCDGTVRRCLLRAGYKRKLPWHKSEMTVWIPPNHKPTFVTSSNRSKRGANQSSNNRSGPPSAQIIVQEEDEHMEHGEEEDEDEENDEDEESEARRKPHESMNPALNFDSAQGSSSIEGLTGDGPAGPGQRRVFANVGPLQTIGAFVTSHRPDHARSSRSASIQPMAHAHTPRRSHTPVHASQEREAHSHPHHKYPSNTFDDGNFTSWQEQMRQKDALIAQLQQQIAQQQSMSNQQAPLTIQHHPQSLHRQQYEQTSQQQVHQPVQQMAVQPTTGIERYGEQMQPYYQWQRAPGEELVTPEQQQLRPPMHQYHQMQPPFPGRPG